MFWLTALCGCTWALGFGGMWVFKWMVNGMVFGWDALRTVSEQITLRASDNGGDLSRIGVLMDNLNIILAKKSYLLLIGACGLATLVPAIRLRRVKIDLRALCLLLPAAAVAMWYLVMANHSHDHTYYTYRNATVMVFSGFAFVSCLLKRGEDA